MIFPPAGENDKIDPMAVLLNALVEVIFQPPKQNVPQVLENLIVLDPCLSIRDEGLGHLVESCCLKKSEHVLPCAQELGATQICHEHQAGKLVLSRNRPRIKGHSVIPALCISGTQ